MQGSENPEDEHDDEGRAQPCAEEDRGLVLEQVTPVHEGRDEHQVVEELEPAPIGHVVDAATQARELAATPAESSLSRCGSA